MDNEFADLRLDEISARLVWTPLRLHRDLFPCWAGLHGEGNVLESGQEGRRVDPDHTSFSTFGTDLIPQRLRYAT